MIEWSNNGCWGTSMLLLFLPLDRHELLFSESMDLVSYFWLLECVIGTED